VAEAASTPAETGADTVSPPGATTPGSGWPFVPVHDTNDLLSTNDAAVWAATFAKILREKGYENDDWEGWLVGWFANAMQAHEGVLRSRGKLYESRIPIPDGYDFSRFFDDADNIITLIYEIVGAGSVCWEHTEFTGIFQDERAVEVAEAALKRLHKLADVRAYTGEIANSAGGS
jgi:hypothetical protein